jgi:hypothetical protein
VLDSESSERFAAQARFAGYALHDPFGRKIGKVEKIFAGGHGGPEYIAVKIGPLWRKNKILIPVEHVSLEDDRRTLVLQ